jgi:hypothetical protein
VDEQSLTAIASVVVAVAALVFSVISFNRQQGRADEQQARAEKLAIDSVKPLLWIQGQNYTNLKSVQLRNHGLGPAVIKLARFERDGVSTDNLIDLFSVAGGTAAWVTYVNLPPKRVVAAGADISLIKQSLEHLLNQGVSDASAARILDRIQETKKGIKVHIEYLDIFGNDIEPLDFTI